MRRVHLSCVKSTLTMCEHPEAYANSQRVVWWNCDRCLNWHQVAVNSHVNIQIFSRCEYFMAVVAFERLAGLVQMDLFLVGHHVSIPTERLRTNITVVIFNLRV